MLEKKNNNSFYDREPYTVDELQTLAKSGAFVSIDFKMPSAEILPKSDGDFIKLGGVNDFIAGHKEIEKQLQQYLLGENISAYKINFIKTDLVEVDGDMGLFKSKYSVKKLANDEYSY